MANLYLVLFANDSKLIGNARSPETIQSDLHCLSHWADAWQMKFNESKCSVLRIGKDNSKSNYTMGYSRKQVVEKERDLGVVVSVFGTPEVLVPYKRMLWCREDLHDHYLPCKITYNRVIVFKLC